MAVDDGLDLAIALGRDDGGYTPGFQVGQDGVGVVALISDQHLWDGPRLGHDRAIASDIVDFPAAQGDRHRQAQAVAPQVDLGREAAARAAKTLVRTPFFAPAECW